MKDYLIVVDIQNDFVDGALGTGEAQAMIDAAAKRIRDFSGKVFVTMDTHFENYMDTREGKKLPVSHCIKGTDGWQLNDRIREALYGKDFDVVEKHTFGSTELPKLIRSDAGDDEVSI